MEHFVSFIEDWTQPFLSQQVSSQNIYGKDTSRRLFGAFNDLFVRATTASLKNLSYQEGTQINFLTF